MDIKTFDQWINTLSTALTAGHKAEPLFNPNPKLGKNLGITWPDNVVPDAPENKLLRTVGTWE